MRTSLLRAVMAGMASFFLSAAATSQTAEGANASDIARRIEALPVLGSVLYVAAHPDDENTRLLAWLRQSGHYHTAYLSLTRGEGGQNLIGNELGDSLGLIRTGELVAARRVDGAEQYFSKARDFGFSKTLNEALAVWGHDQVLGDVVRQIRQLQPDVIITRFPADSRAGHGHHQASSRLAQEAFEAAADPARFPEQLQELRPWRAKRIVWNTWEKFLGSGDTRADDQLKLAVGAVDPLSGLGAGEIAAKSRDNHKSQGFGSEAQRGEAIEYFAPLGGPVARLGLFDGIDTTWTRLGAEDVPARIAKIRKAFRPTDPAASVPALLALRDRLARLPGGVWRERKLAEVDQLVVAAAGLFVDALVERPSVALGQPVNVRLEVLSRSALGAELVEATAGPSSVPPAAGGVEPLAPNRLVVKTLSFVPDRLTQPYWLGTPHGDGRFETPHPAGAAGNADAPAVSVTVRIAGRLVTVVQPIRNKQVDPIRGEIYRPLLVAPPVTATPADAALFFPQGKSQHLRLTLQAVGPASGVIRPVLPTGWRAEPTNLPFSFTGAGESGEADFQVTAEAGAAVGTVRFSIEIGQARFDRAFTQIDYPHVPGLGWFPPSETRLVPLAIERGSQRIGYLPGAGDDIPRVLRQLGYEVEELDAAKLSDTALDRFDAVITGVRAYNVDPRLKDRQPALLRYVERGGTLLVQYNNDRPLAVAQLGPYPFRISRDRVTDQDSPVQIREPDNRLLTYPNRISARDFSGWIQDRGLYFAADVDARYAAPLGLTDPGEVASSGGLIIADYGKGRFIYSPLAFFRQLPAGVPGAARLFANLISHR